ncbi:MAG: hypothetical protein OI74_11965 [Gammaproteobacteria bacterium (ex Lamellibrachia satsuma)]|nr:MAG: hypothetical protein HPY30_02010 [Gammaproteobacteria bacterium (ex Lamellibrachia satsuma)]RRS32256.1 MAG: hypothetical protein OI74_11965 [Gammaproteobacteria bacterium (ex Lamellibrachia satsuma)]RRS33262.1 MAG: hypothetical protein NV67_16810 [Gammaproteobacteria bacterium (ex Lamellibrachia satsuma)]
MQFSFLRPTITLCILLGSICQPAQALELRWLQYSPVRYFTDKDWDMMKETARELFNSGKDGDSAAWENPESGNQGSLKALSTMEKGGTTCREAEITNQAGKRSGTSRFTFCRQADGTWKISR